MDENQAPLKVKINDQEYDVSEAQELINKGKATSEAEKKYNTTLDKVWPEYGKSQTSLKEMQEKIEKYEADIAKFQDKKEEGTETKQDEAKAKEAARKLGIVLNEDLDKDFIRKSDLDKYLEDRDSKKDALQSILKQADKLETEIDGKDGRPKFNKKVVLAYAQAYEKKSLEEAYEDMHADALKEWREAEIENKKNPGLKTFTPGEKKEPRKVKVTDDNFSGLLNEALYGTK